MGFIQVDILFSSTGSIRHNGPQMFSRKDHWMDFKYLRRIVRSLEWILVRTEGHQVTDRHVDVAFAGRREEL